MYISFVQLHTQYTRKLWEDLYNYTKTHHIHSSLNTQRFCVFVCFVFHSVFGFRPARRICSEALDVYYMYIASQAGQMVNYDICFKCAMRVLKCVSAYISPLYTHGKSNRLYIYMSTRRIWLMLTLELYGHMTHEFPTLLVISRCAVTHPAAASFDRCAA